MKLQYTYTQKLMPLILGGGVFAFFSLNVHVCRSETQESRVLQTSLKPNENKPEMDAISNFDAASLAMALGYQFGEKLCPVYGVKAIEEVAKLPLEPLLAGVRAGFLGEDKPVTDERAQEMTNDLIKKVRDSQIARAASAANKAESFLAENAKKEGIETTSTGLQYQVLTVGKGGRPSVGDTVKVRYKGTLLDGTVFDQNLSDEASTDFKINDLVPGSAQALLSMSVGSKWRLWIPSRLAYGTEGLAPHIGPGDLLILEQELIGIE